MQVVPGSGGAVSFALSCGLRDTGAKKSLMLAFFCGFMFTMSARHGNIDSGGDVGAWRVSRMVGALVARDFVRALTCKDATRCNGLQLH
jgi:hypothetical protein